MKRILVVDDNENDYRLIRTQLLNLAPDVDIDWAGSVNEARKFLMQQRYCLALIDVRIGPADGVLFLDEIKNSRLIGDMQVVTMTGYPRKIDEVASREIGAAMYIIKPFDLTELKSTLAKVLKLVDESHAQQPSA